MTPEEVESVAVESETLDPTPARPEATRTSSADADAETLAVVRELYGGDLPAPDSETVRAASTAGDGAVDDRDSEGDPDSDGDLDSSVEGLQS